MADVERTTHDVIVIGAGHNGLACAAYMSPDQLFCFRPIPGYGDYRSPVKDLYLCGSGTHPGGGVMGVPGRNCAQVVGRDARRGWFGT